MTIIPNKYQLECDEQIRQLTEMYEARIKELESKPIPPISEGEIVDILDDYITTIHDYYFKQDCKRAAKAIINLINKNNI
jgi:hypothetical protein